MGFASDLPILRTEPPSLALPINPIHIRVTLARHRVRETIECREIGRVEGDCDCGGVLLQTFDLCRSRNGHDHLALCQHPGECDLGRCRAFPLRNLPDVLDELRVSLEIGVLETRQRAAEIVVAVIRGNR